MEEGRMVHSCRLRRVIGSAVGRGDVMTVVNASRKEVEEQAQKSRAFSFGSEVKRVRRTEDERSSSMCSWARNSRRLGVRERHCSNVAGIRLRV